MAESSYTEKYLGKWLRGCVKYMAEKVSMNTMCLFIIQVYMYDTEKLLRTMTS